MFLVSTLNHDLPSSSLPFNFLFPTHQPTVYLLVSSGNVLCFTCLPCYCSYPSHWRSLFLQRLQRDRGKYFNSLTVVRAASKRSVNPQHCSATTSQYINLNTFNYQYVLNLLVKFADRFISHISYDILISMCVHPESESQDVHIDRTKHVNIIAYINNLVIFVHALYM